MHDVADMELDILASKLQLEVGYTISSHEEHALTIQISGLPPTMAKPEFIDMSVRHYLMKVEIKIKSCDIFDGVVYIVLEDPSSEFFLPCKVNLIIAVCFAEVADIVSHPPQGTFLANTTLHYSSIPLSRMPTAGSVPSPVTVEKRESQTAFSQGPPLSPPYHQPYPSVASTPTTAGPQPHLPDGSASTPVQYQKYDPSASGGYTTDPSIPYQRISSSSSTSSQPWDPNASGGYAVMSQKIDLNASSSSVKSTPHAHSPHKWQSQDSADSSDGYASSWSSQMSQRYKPNVSADGGMQPWTTVPAPQAVGQHQYLPHQGSEERTNFQQQYSGSPQGQTVPGERIRSSSGPISMEEEKSEGLWMGSSPRQPQRPRSARQYANQGRGL